MRFAYADPPYPGLAYHYGESEVDHATLIALLESHFPDGWALSTSSVALRQVLPLCPEGTRVMSWCKTWCSWKPSQRLVYAWEPVLLRGGRGKQPGRGSVRDFLMCRIATRKQFFGAKPLQFSLWVFEALGATSEDEMVDIFTGSGAVGAAWDTFIRQLRLDGVTTRKSHTHANPSLA